MKKYLFIVLALFSNLLANELAFTSLDIAANKHTVKPGEFIELQALIVKNKNIAYTLTWTDDIKGKYIFESLKDVIWVAPNKRSKTKIKLLLVDFFGNILRSEINILVEYGNIPVANDDVDIATFYEDNAPSLPYSGEFNTSMLLQNDTDSDGDTLKVVDIKTRYVDEELFRISDDKTSIKFIPYSTFDYLPHNVHGKLFFSYTISDGNGNTATANGNIVVIGINDPSVINNDKMFLRLPDSNVSMNITLNDTDVDDNSSFRIIEVGSNIVPENGTITIDSKYGSYLVNYDGNVTFFVDKNNTEITMLNAKDKVDDILEDIAIKETYSQHSDIQKLKVTIYGENDAPIAVDDDYSIINNPTILDDFETYSDKWSNHNISNTISLTSFIEPVDGQEIFKRYSLNKNHAHTTVEVEFDFYEFGTWNNDKFKVFVNDNLKYENIYDNNGILTNIANFFGLYTHVKYSFLAKTDNFGTIKLGFASENNASFGIDNIKIKILPLQVNKNDSIKIPSALLLLNDIDPDDEISFKSASNLFDDNNNTLAISSTDSNGFISFEPNEAFFDSGQTTANFVYTIRDTYRLESNATVKLKLLEDDIVLIDDHIEIYENKNNNLSGNIFTNDTNKNNTALIVDTLSNNIVGKYGTLTILPDGYYTFAMNSGAINIRHKDKLRDVFIIQIKESATGLLRSEKIIIDIHGVIKAKDDKFDKVYGEYTVVSLDKDDYINNNDDYKFEYLEKVEVNAKAYIKGTQTIFADVSYQEKDNIITYTPTIKAQKLQNNQNIVVTIKYEIFAKLDQNNIIDGVTSLSSMASIDLNITSSDIFFRCPKNRTKYDLDTDSCISNGGVDFNNLFNWSTVASSDPSVHWQVNADGKSVLQQENTSFPSIFLAPGDFDYLSFETEIKVTDDPFDDSDFIGLVFGYKSNEYLLFDWKKAEQVENNVMAKEGYILSTVDANNNANDNWGHTGDTTILDELIGNGTGWTKNTYHKLIVSYNANKISVSVNGKQVLNYDTINAPIGQIGFYNYSQANAEYKNFKIVPYDCEANGYVTTQDKISCATK